MEKAPRAAAVPQRPRCHTSHPTAGANPCHTESHGSRSRVGAQVAPSDAEGVPPIPGSNQNLPWKQLAPLTPLPSSPHLSLRCSHLKAGDWGTTTTVARQQTRSTSANQPLLHHDPRLTLPARTHAQPSEPRPGTPMPCAPRLASSYLANQRATSGLNFCSSSVCRHEATQRVGAAPAGTANPWGTEQSTPG